MKLGGWTCVVCGKNRVAVNHEACRLSKLTRAAPKKVTKKQAKSSGNYFAKFFR